MNTSLRPLVSVVTPVYNGAEYLAECIESVLAQSYTNWDFTIVNNCSTDESLAIAQKYAARDPRIRVVTTDRFLRIIENHNETIRKIAPDSKYCKLVFADDWLYPHCLEEMVLAAEKNPSVGLVGAYTMDGQSVLWTGPRHPSHRIPGREICREFLMAGPYIFGTWTSLLVRSDLVRKRKDFFNEQNLHADSEACLDVLQESDFAFVHQVLSFSRPSEASTRAFSANFDSITLGVFVVFLKYGPVFLNQAEYARSYKALRWEYYLQLGHNLLRIRSKEFWKYHEDTLAAFGAKIDSWLLMRAAVTQVFRRLSRPIYYFKKGWCWWSQKLGRVAGKHPAQTQRIP